MKLIATIMLILWIFTVINRTINNRSLNKNIESKMKAISNVGRLETEFGQRVYYVFYIIYTFMYIFITILAVKGLDTL